MVKELLVSSSLHETKVAILEEDQLAEVYFEHADEYSIAGSIYKGRVTRVLPGMQSAFVDIGFERDAFLYVSDFLDEAEVFDKIDNGVGNGLSRTGRGAASLPTRPLAAPQRLAPIPAPEDRLPEVAPEAPVETTRPPGRRRRGRRRARRPFRERGLPQAKYAARSEASFQRGELTSRDRSLPQARYVQSTEGSQQEERTPASPPSSSIVSQHLVPMVLPGESLAKYRNLTPSPLEGPTLHEPSTQEIGKPEETEPTPEPVRGAQPEPRFEDAPQEEASSPEPDTWSASEPAPEGTEADGPQFEQLPATPTESGSAPEPVLEVTPAVESVEQPQTEQPAPAAEEEAAEESVPQTPEDISPLAVIEEDEEAIAVGEQNGQPEQTVAEESSVAGVENAPAREPEGERMSAPAPHFGRRLGRRQRRKMLSERGQSQRPQAPADRAVRAQPLITDLLREGQEILVQVAKEPLGRKGARITSHIALPGRYLVYMPTLEPRGSFSQGDYRGGAPPLEAGRLGGQARHPGRFHCPHRRGGP